jgi:hypothetical protein
MEGPTGDDPNPPYTEWPDLCNANLQQAIELPGIDPAALLTALKDGTAFPDVLPAAFIDFWFSALDDTFGSIGEGSRFRKDQLNGAYLMTWLMLWFQTSGQVLGCLPIPPVASPDADCGAEPPWVKGSVPPAQSIEQAIEQDVDEGKVICGVVLARAV